MYPEKPSRAHETLEVEYANRDEALANMGTMRERGWRPMIAGPGTEGRTYKVLYVRDKR